MHDGTRTVLIFRYFRVAALLCMVCFCASVHAQDAMTLRVQILNGKTGRPLVNQKIVLMTKTGPPAEAAQRLASEVTDGEGYAALPAVNDPAAAVLVYVEAHQPCSKTAKRSFAPTKVRVTGIVSENSCKTRISMYPQPGTLIFFVRPETFLEKMRR